MAIALIHSHGIHRHLAFIEADKRQSVAAWRPFQRVEDAELLLVNPVGHAVDNLVFLTVGGHSGNRAVGKVFDIYIVILHESHFLVVGAERSNLFPTLVGELGDALALHVVHIVVGNVGIAINHLGVGVQENLCFVVAHLVAVPIGDFTAFQFLAVKNSGFVGFVLIRNAEDFRAIGALLIIILTV